MVVVVGDETGKNLKVTKRNGQRGTRGSLACHAIGIKGVPSSYQVVAVYALSRLVAGT